MSKQWARFAGLILFLACPPSGRSAQLAPEIVREISNAITPVLDVVCTDMFRTTYFTKGKVIGQSVSEQSVASARTNGDRLTAFTETTRVNGVPVPNTNANSNINVGASFSDQRLMIFRSQVGFFTFRIAAPDTSVGPPDSRLIIEFELKKQMPGVTPYLPDSGKAVIDRETKRVIRLELRYLGVTQVPGPTFPRGDTTIIQNFGHVSMEEASAWMATYSTTHLIEEANKDRTRIYVHDYGNCKKFRVSVSIKTED